MSVDILLRNGTFAYTSPTEVASHADQTVLGAPEATPVYVLTVSVSFISMSFYIDC
jgi:hypothetical protein